MRVVKEFPSYNPRRYSKPWIARVTDWPHGSHPVLAWGVCLDAWTVELNAEPGDVIRWGQKDQRGNRTENHWGVLAQDGTLERCSVLEARSHWIERQEQLKGAA